MSTRHVRQPYRSLTKSHANDESLCLAGKITLRSGLAFKLLHNVKFALGVFLLIVYPFSKVTTVPRTHHTRNFPRSQNTAAQNV